MRNFARTVCALAALTAAYPALAQAQTATAFDGTYRGVSRQLEGAAFGGTARACPLQNGPPTPLRIVNGVARAGSNENPMEGSVTAQGVLMMRNARGVRFDGQIDSQGRASGRLMYGCSYQLVWQRL
jgi:hypothetical protein